MKVESNNEPLVLRLINAVENVYNVLIIDLSNSNKEVIKIKSLYKNNMQKF